METEVDKLLEQEGINLNTTTPAFTSEDAAAVIISDEEVISFPGGWPEAISTPKIEVAWGHKQPLEDRSPCSSPPKKQATEVTLPREMSDKSILPRDMSLYLRL